MAERYSGVVGEKIELYYYGRSSAGVYRELHDIGKVYIYPSDPVDNWGGNVVMESPFGSVPLSPGMNKLYDTSVDFLDKDIEVGQFIEINIGNNVGKYKIKSILSHMIEIDESFAMFPAAENNISYEITKLRAILSPTTTVAGTYKVEWDIPSSESGGYYYDLWTVIKETHLSAAYDEVQTMYVSKILPYSTNGNEYTLGNRYTSRIGKDVALDMFFRESPLSAPIDPFSITSVNLYRFDPTTNTTSGSSAPGPTPAVASLFGECDAGDLYLLKDMTVDFTLLSNALRKYDTIEIIAPALLAGFYRIDYMVDANTIRLMRPLPVFIPSGIDYEAHYMYHLDSASCSTVSEPVKVGIGEYNIMFTLPSDLAVGRWWDRWDYVPDAGVLETDITYSFNDLPPYYLSDPTAIEVDAADNNVVQLVDQGGGVYSQLKPYVKLVTPVTLTDPSHIAGVLTTLGVVNDGVVEYSIEINGVDFWYNGAAWVENTGYLCGGMGLWSATTSYWPMDVDWFDSRRSNDGTHFGTGVEFTTGSPFGIGDIGTFNGTDDHVVVNHSTSLWTEDTDFSFTFAFRTAAVVDQVIAMNAFRAAAGSGSPGWAIGTLATGELYFRASDGTQGSLYSVNMNSTTAWNDGNYHMCTISVERDNLNTNVEIMVDGDTDGILSLSGSTLILGNNYPLVFGVDHNGGSYDQLRYDGELGLFGFIENVALTIEDHRRLRADAINNKHTLEEEVFNNHIDDMLLNSGDTVNLLVYLVSDGTQAQQIDQVDLRWKYYSPYPASAAIGEVQVHEATYVSAPGAIDSCAVVGRLLALGGNPLMDEEVVVYAANEPIEVENMLVGNRSLSVRTDTGGYFQMYLPQGKHVWISVPAVGFRKKVKIPAATKVSFMELIKQGES